MYTNTNTNHFSNSIFLCIRNTPYNKLNTNSFRRDLLSIVDEYINSDQSDDSHDNDSVKLPDKLDDYVLTAENYSVHFILPKNLVDEPKLCSLYGFEGFEGVFIIKDFLTQAQCLTLACETLRSYINPPSKSNLLIKDPGLSSPIWPSDNFKGLRWSTIGHLYDWEKRQYDGYSHFPDIIVKIVNEINKLLSQFYDPFIADAAIINFYSKSYFLRLHRDDAEETNDPVINISIGAPAIFCICKDGPSQFPLSCVVDSGSIFIMSNDSRRCLHGISKLLHYVKPDSECEKCSELASDTPSPFAKPYFINTFHQCHDQVFEGFTTSLDEESISEVKSYLTNSRISISIRKAKR